MRSAITPAYIFTPGGPGAGTLNLSGIPNFNINRLIIVVDTTTQVTLFAMGITGNGYNSISSSPGLGATLTLTADTSMCASTDNLTIFYDDGNSLPALDNGRLPVALPDSHDPLRVEIVPNEAAGEYTQHAEALLGMSFDSATGVRQQVDIPGLIDPRAGNAGAKIADCAGPFFFEGSVAGQIIGVIDTTGYQSVEFIQYNNGIPTAPNLTWQAFHSNDGTLNASNIAVGWSVAVSTNPTTTFGGNAVPLPSAPVIYPCSGRYLIVRILAATAGILQLSCYLRQAPMSTVGILQAVNLVTIAGSNVVNGGVVGVLSAGGNVAPGVAATANPLPGGGVDAGNLTRRTLMDTSGRTIVVDNVIDQGGTTRNLPVLSPAATVTGLAALTTMDQSRSDDGQSTVDLLVQILKEMQINNLYMAQLAWALNTGYIQVDEPNDLRNTPALIQ
jgi:hypothetical protein